MRTIDISRTARRLGAVRVYNLFFFMTLITAFSHVVADIVAANADVGDAVMFAILLPIAWLLWASADPVLVTKNKWSSFIYAYSIVLCLLAILVTALPESEVSSILKVTYAIWFGLLLLVAVRALFSARRFRADEIGDLGVKVSRLIGADPNIRPAKTAPERKALAFSLTLVGLAVVMLLLRAYTEDSGISQLQAFDLDHRPSAWDRISSQLDQLFLTAAVYLILKARESATERRHVAFEGSPSGDFVFTIILGRREIAGVADVTILALRLFPRRAARRAPQFRGSVHSRWLA